jgi:hypothetical protein
VRLCEDCKHHGRWVSTHTCLRPVGGASPVTGEIRTLSEPCESERSGGRLTVWLFNKCGPDALHFYPRLGPDACQKAPEGWECSRNAGHEGPCAAWPAVPAPPKKR